MSCNFACNWLDGGFRDDGGGITRYTNGEPLVGNFHVISSFAASLNSIHILTHSMFTSLEILQPLLHIFDHRPFSSKSVSLIQDTTTGWIFPESNIEVS